MPIVIRVNTGIHIGGAIPGTTTTTTTRTTTTQTGSVNTENKGEEIKEVFYPLSAGPARIPATLDLPKAVNVFKCITCNNVFAHATDNSEFKNDITDFLYRFSALSTVKMFIEKFNGGAYEEVAELKDNTYGLYHALGFKTDSGGNLYTGYHIYWQKVLIALGPGLYRLRIDETYMGATTSQYTEEYCLSVYSAYMTNGTVRIEATIYNVMGDLKDKSSIIDFSTGWYQSIRLNGIFGYDKATYIKEYNEFHSGIFKPYKMEATQEFTLKLYQLSGYLHRYISTYYLMSDEIMITDYNSNNPFSHIQEKVCLKGDYSPLDDDGNTELLDVNIDFKSGWNNLRKRLSN